MSKKKFKETTLGKLVMGAASIVSPPLAKILEGATSPREALAEITKSNISPEDKIKLQQMMYDQQNKEMESVTARWNADLSANGSWLTRNVRPMVLIWCIVIFSLAGILDSVENIPFQINSLWNDTFEKLMISVVLSYFGGRSYEKGRSIMK